MHYKDLLKATELFMEYPISYDYSYRRALLGVDWRHFDRLSKDEIIDKAIKFLNEWSCRLPSAYYNVIADGMKKAFNQVNPLITMVENETLEDIDFRAPRNIGNEKLDHFEILHSIFAEFCGVGHKFRWVAASKTLHQMLPKLFVMWDNPICEKLGFSLNTRSYVHDFLPLMQKEANEAIETCMKDQGCARDVAIHFIIEKCSEICGYDKTLTKLVDEYNWMKYTKGCLK